MNLLNKWRVPLTVLGAILMLGGSIWSIQNLELQWSELVWLPLLANLFIGQAALLVVAAISLQLSARISDAHLSFRDSLRTVSYANFAELLPIPGGAMVRIAALKAAGARLNVATSVIALTAVLMLAMLVSLSALLLAMTGTTVAWIVFATGVGGFLVTFWLIARRAGIIMAVLIFLVRIATTIAGIAVLKLAFDSIAQTNTLIEVAILSVSATLGNAVAIAPSGLGIGEAIAASLATLTTIAPAAAFLAVALSRSLGLILSMVFALVLRGAKPTNS